MRDEFSIFNSSRHNGPIIQNFSFIVCVCILTNHSISVSHSLKFSLDGPFLCVPQLRVALPKRQILRLRAGRSMARCRSASVLGGQLRREDHLLVRKSQ
jgi:hypothetical protein